MCVCVCVCVCVMRGGAREREDESERRLCVTSWIGDNRYLGSFLGNSTSNLVTGKSNLISLFRITFQRYQEYTDAPKL